MIIGKSLPVARAFLIILLLLFSQVAIASSSSDEIIDVKPGSSWGFPTWEHSTTRFTPWYPSMPMNSEPLKDTLSVTLYYMCSAERSGFFSWPYVSCRASPHVTLYPIILSGDWVSISGERVHSRHLNSSSSYLYQVLYQEVEPIVTVHHGEFRGPGRTYRYKLSDFSSVADEFISRQMREAKEEVFSARIRYLAIAAASAIAVAIFVFFAVRIIGKNAPKIISSSKRTTEGLIKKVDDHRVSHAARVETAKLAAQEKHKSAASAIEKNIHAQISKCLEEGDVETAKKLMAVLRGQDEKPREQDHDK